MISENAAWSAIFIAMKLKYLSGDHSIISGDQFDCL